MDLLFSIPFAFGVASGDVFWRCLGLAWPLPVVSECRVVLLGIFRAPCFFRIRTLRFCKRKTPTPPAAFCLPQNHFSPRHCLGSHHSSTSFSVSSPCNALWKPIEWNAFLFFSFPVFLRNWHTTSLLDRAAAANGTMENPATCDLLFLRTSLTDQRYVRRPNGGGIPRHLGKETPVTPHPLPPVQQPREGPPSPWINE